MRLRDIEGHLSRFRVGIAGAGGLGSNCAAFLARAGIGSLVIADFDNVDMSNLSRQYYFPEQSGMPKTEALRENLLRIRPHLDIITRNVRLDRENSAGIFGDCSVIVEALDEAEMKRMFAETIQLLLPEIPLILGSGMAGWGGNNRLRSRKIDGTLYICGDEISEVSEEKPPLAPRVGIVACMQANIVVELLMNLK
ncbi:MAG: sulfur carrier protein ThiS adenylyltransferase ThiF [Bacteroidales bacterium]|jgi:sulfur carrier protein ThiS adenylyltransferase|nr:sulfur carrier protein ThiS adenylyltransferase ThiF [Bacteroidales bacterium]